MPATSGTVMKLLADRLRVRGEWNAATARRSRAMPHGEHARAVSGVNTRPRGSHRGLARSVRGALRLPPDEHITLRDVGRPVHGRPIWASTLCSVLTKRPIPGEQPASVLEEQPSSASTALHLVRPGLASGMPNWLDGGADERRADLGIAAGTCLDGYACTIYGGSTMRAQ